MIQERQCGSNRRRELRSIHAGGHAVPFAEEQRVIQGGTQTRQRMAERGCAHRQLVSGQPNGAVAVNRVENGQQV